MKRMFRFSIVVMLPFLLLLATNVFAGDPFYYDQRTRLVNNSTEILINHGLCMNENDCHKKQLIFTGGSTGGIYLNVYGISDLPVIEGIISASVSEYGSNDKKIGISVEFYKEKHEEVEGLISPFFISPYIKLHLLGEK